MTSKPGDHIEQISDRFRERLGDVLEEFSATWSNAPPEPEIEPFVETANLASSDVRNHDLRPWKRTATRRIAHSRLSILHNHCVFAGCLVNFRDSRITFAVGALSTTALLALGVLAWTSRMIVRSVKTLSRMK